MNPNIERIKLIFIGAFALLIVGVGVYQVGWAMPQNKCEKDERRWWDAGQRVCATPILITTITRRPAADRAAESAAAAAMGQPAPKH